MKKIALFCGVLSVGCFVFGGGISEIARRSLEDSSISGSIAVRGENQWLYSRSELEFLRNGVLTKEKIAEVSKSTKPANADPVAAIADFDKQLKDIGVRLIVVPVPPKAAVYPLPGAENVEVMANLAPLYERIRNENIELLDISGALIQAAEGEQVFCKGDSHWSQSGIAVAAKEVAKLMAFNGKEKFHYSEKQLEFTGDLALSANIDMPETMKIIEVENEVFSEASEVLVLSDSHGLVFSAGGEMLAENGGFCELLALETGSKVDRIAVKGSASTPVRVNLYRKAAKDAGWIKNKKFVIWLFTCREFTESGNGFQLVPVLKK